MLGKDMKKMNKSPKSEFSLPLRIILVAPITGVDFGIQEGKGHDYKTIQIQMAACLNQILPTRSGYLSWFVQAVSGFLCLAFLLPTTTLHH